MTYTVRKTEYCAVNTYLHNGCAVTAYNDLWGFTTSVMSPWRPLLCRYLCVRTCPCMGVNTVLSYQQQNKLRTKVSFLSPVACCTECLFLQFHCQLWCCSADELMPWRLRHIKKFCFLLL